MTDYREAHGLKWVTGDRGDDYILKESSYACLFPPKNTSSLCPEDTWLDIGAHFGSFALRIAPLVGRVIAVEPFPGNVTQLNQNCILNGIRNVDVLPMAVVGGPTENVNLALGHTFDYTHRVGHIRGRKNLTVAGINVNELVDAYGINKIKMDAEGSEDHILWALNYSSIEEIILEWHFTLIPDPDWVKLRSVLALLRGEDFRILRAPEDASKVTKRWTAIIWLKKG